MKQRKERRREPRARIARPVYMETAYPHDKHFEEVRMTRDLSRWGFSFVTEKNWYWPGMQLNAIPALGYFNLEYECEVVRVEPLPTGEFGVAVRLLCVRNPIAVPNTLVRSTFHSLHGLSPAPGSEYMHVPTIPVSTVSGCSNLAKIATETLRRFLVEEGSIGVVDRGGVTRMLHPALPPEYLDLAQTADRFWHNRTWHSREEFLQLCTECRIEIQRNPPFESEDAEPTPTTCAALAV